MDFNAVIKSIVVATLVCGTLDILFAVLLSLAIRRRPADTLRYVASGPFPKATEWGASGSILGLVVHYVLMAVIVAAFVIVARNDATLLGAPLIWGLVYGLLTYVAMNLIVVPLRFAGAWPPKALSIVTQLFAHVVLVGWPLAYISRFFLQR